MNPIKNGEIWLFVELPMFPKVPSKGGGGGLRGKHGGGSGGGWFKPCLEGEKSKIEKVFSILQ